MNENYTNYLLDKTRQDYNQISEHFSITRGFLNKELKDLYRFCKQGDKVLDMGCGNGRLLDIFSGKNIDYLGIDNSEKLIRIANSRFPNRKFFVADALNLPFPESYFDKIFTVAVFHHIPSQKLRLKFLEEAKRILKPNGLLILSAWNLYQKRFLKFHLKYTLLKIIGLSKLDFKDIFYPWKSSDGKILTQRYLHGFTIRELKNLIKRSGLRLKEIGFLDSQKRNIYLVAQKQPL